MPGIAVGGERIVEPAHQLRCLAINRRLVTEQARLHADDKAERLDVALQVGEWKVPLAARLKVHQLEPLKVADHHVARALHLRQPIVIVERLRHRAREIAAGAFLLHDQRAGPEQVDKAASS